MNLKNGVKYLSNYNIIIFTSINPERNNKELAGILENLRQQTIKKYTKILSNKQIFISPSINKLKIYLFNNFYLFLVLYFIDRNEYEA